MFPLKTELYPEISFELKVDVLQAGDGIARIRVDEVNSKTPWKRYDETPKWALVDAEPAVADKSEVKFESHASTTVISYGEGHSLSLVIQHSPLKITHKRHGKTIMIINERGLFHMEHFRPKEPEAHPEGQVTIHEGMDRTWFEGEADKDLFEETFSKWTDSKPKGVQLSGYPTVRFVLTVRRESFAGPEAYSFDVSFPGVEHVFGLAEHATPLSLPATE
jgi:alpha 1,3-glucosidase